MPTTAPLHFERLIPAPPAEAFRAFTHPTALRDWLADEASSQPRPEGYLFLHWNDGYSATCQITRFERPGSLDFTWSSLQDPGPTRVSVRFAVAGDGVKIMLEHAGFGKGAAWEQDRQEKERAWSASLENLESFLLEGIDLRQARRPRLGIWMDDLTPEIAARLGLPVSEGVLLAGTVPGSGAEASGLQKDDLLVSFNGVPLASPASFNQALAGLQSGDKPIVEYYRGGEKRSTPVELGRFPIPPLPESPSALAAELRQINARVHAGLSEQVAGLGESQAGRRPQENEWSVKELLGHFILTERDYQSWAADMLRDNPAGDSLLFRPNVDERIAALLVRCPTVKSLLAELAAAQGETAGLLAALPEHFITWRRHLYRRLADWSREYTPVHLDEEHAEQLARTIAAVRNTP